MMNKYADIYVFQWGNEGRAGVPERRIRKRSGRGEEERRRRILLMLYSFYRFLIQEGGPRGNYSDENSIPFCN